MRSHPITNPLSPPLRLSTFIIAFEDCFPVAGGNVQAWYLAAPANGANPSTRGTISFKILDGQSTAEALACLHCRLQHFPRAGHKGNIDRISAGVDCAVLVTLRFQITPRHMEALLRVRWILRLPV